MSDNEEMYEEEIVEGSWICPFCSMKNRGRNIKCEGCGQARGEVEFIYEEEGEICEDGDTGPDWLCAYCGFSNVFQNNDCNQCGASKSEGKNREVTEVDFNDIGDKKPGIKSPPPSPRKPASPIFKYILFGIIGFLIFAAIIGSCTYDQTVITDNYLWERTIDVDEYKTLTKENWRDSVPSTATILRTDNKIRSYRRVQTGTEMVKESYTEKVKNGTKRVKAGRTNLGNGKFKNKYKNVPVYKSITKYRDVRRPVYRKDPVYDKWIKYQNNEWVKIDMKRTHGADNKPRWPDIKENSSAIPKVGDQRAGTKKETITVVFKDIKKKTLFKVTELNDIKFDETAFEKYPLESKWKLTSDVNDVAIKIEKVK